MSKDAISDISNFFSYNNDKSTIKVGDPDAVEKFYAKLKEKGYNLDELKDILECDDNMLIVSAAGSGKTTTLLLKILRDILSGKLIKENTDGMGIPYLKKILVCTFLKTGAAELGEKFNELCKTFDIIGVKSDQIAFRTIHSEVYQAITGMNVKLNIVEESETSDILKSACKAYKVHSVMSKNSKVLTRDELSDIACILTYARNRLDDSRYNHPLMKEYNLDEITLKGLMSYCAKSRALLKVQDFEDIEEILYDAYPRYPKVSEFINNRYDYVYIDEFQDTSQLQYAILKPYFDHAKGFLCLGDEDQCIYGWRGSDVNLILNQFEEDYHPTIKKLSVNRRCAENILECIVPSIENNKQRHSKVLRASKPGGEVEVVIDGGVNYLTKALSEDLLTSQKIGILGRTNADLLIPALLLAIEGYNSFSISKSISLKDRIPSQVLGIIRLITQRYTEEFEGYFKLFLNKYNGYEATKLCEVLRNNSKDSIFTLPLEDIRYSAPDLFYIIRMLRVECEKNPVLAYVSLLDILEQDVYNGKTIYAQRARDFIYYIKKIVTEHKTIKNMTIQELDTLFLTTLPSILDSKKPQSSKRKQNEKGQWVTEKVPVDNSYIKITTVHDAKGKEWDYVYIWNDVDGCFPNSVGNRELTPEELEEERRVHYIAWTRPTKKLVVFTRHDRADGFLKECDLSKVKKIDFNKEKSQIGLQSDKEETTENSVNEVDWKQSVKDYVLKYTSYQYICSPVGNTLDICLTKLNGIDGLIAYLENFQLGSYPQSDIENAISDILKELTENC